MKPATLILPTLASYAIGLFLGFLLGTNQPLETKKPITPELEILIKNGVPDTTYIYRAP